MSNWPKVPDISSYDLPTIQNVDCAKKTLSRVYHHTQNRAMGMLTAHRGHLTAAENHARNASLKEDIRKHGFGFMPVKGTYTENKGTPHERQVHEESFLVTGPHGDDHGRMKGFLKKHGEKYDQDSVLYKPHHEEDAYLIGTNHSEFPGYGKTHHLGKFHPNRAAEFKSVLRKGKSFSFENAALITDYKLEFQNPLSFFNRVPHDFI
jgi:hypothetical protein